MAKSKLLALFLVTLAVFSVVAQAPTYKVAYIPQSIGQPNTNA